MNDAEPWRIENLFDAAVDLPPDERSAFLNEHCGVDLELRRRVERLLELDDSDGGVLAQPHLAPGAEGWSGSPHVFAPGNIIAGKYRIERVIGEGGMGTVFLAQQINPPRPVALKVIGSGRGSSGSQQLFQRFEREAKALGRLHHPGIATIFEAGAVHSGGRKYPYFAMEFVDGLPLPEHAARFGLDVRARIELMVHVADAVQHAHEQHVIHRDLKPANILVIGESSGRGAGGEGEGEAAADAVARRTLTPALSQRQRESRARVKVLDFGIARLVRRGDEPHSLTLQTDSGQLLGTLPYMSPEQVGGDPLEIDERTDVYALGVILFELLTGRLPYSVRGKSVAEAARIIRDEEPSRLSAIDPHLHGDVETIVLKAIDKDKSRRYSSAADFAADLRRFLREEPITARPPSAIYRMRKFARRNRALVGGIAGIIGALLMGLTLTSVFAVRAGRSAETARQKEVAASEQRRLAEQQAYRATVAAASAALDSHNVVLARAYLNDAPRHMRGWEWNHLASRLDDSAAAFTAADRGDQAARCWPHPTESSIFCVELAGLVAVTEWSLQPDGLRAVNRVLLDERPWRSFSVSPLGSAVAWASAVDPVVRVHHLLTGASGQWESPLEPGRWDLGGVAVNDTATVLAVAVDPWDFDGQAPLFLINIESDQTTRFENTHSAVNGQLALAPGTPPRFIALANGERSVAEILDVRTGEIIELRGHTGGVICTAVSPDGERIATGSRDSTWRLWDARTGRPLAVMRGHRAAIFAIQFSPDGRRLATASDDHTVALWDVDTGDALGPALARVLRGHERSVGSLAFDPLGQTLVSTDSEGTTRLWNAAAVEPFVLRGHRSYVYPVVTSPDGRIAASGAWDATIRLWDLVGPGGAKELTFLHGHARPVILLAFNSTGERLVSFADQPETTLRVWDVPTGREIAQLPYHSKHCAQLAFHPDNERVFISWVEEDNAGPIDFDNGATSNRIVAARYWRPGTGDFETEPLPVAPHPGWNTRRGGVVSPDGSLAVAIDHRDDRSLIRIFDAATGVVRCAFTSTVASPVVWLNTRPLRVITADQHGGDAIVVRDAATGLIEHVLRGHAGPIFAITVSPDNSRLITGGRDQSIHIWDITMLGSGHTPLEVAQLRGHESYVWSVAFTPDGRTLISGSGDHTVRVWDTRSAADRAKE